MSDLIHLHPLVFTLQDAVTGCGFLAGIVVTGKAVMEHEDGKWWMYGVCPGGIAASGDTTNEAFIDFRNKYKEALFDIAEECQSFLGFRKAVQEFFEADKRESTRWDLGLKILRENEGSISDPFKNLPRKHPGEYQLCIRIDRLENKDKSSLKPSNNIQDSLAKVA
jgi:hypothetical protein